MKTFAQQTNKPELFVGLAVFVYSPAKYGIENGRRFVSKVGRDYFQMGKKDFIKRLGPKPIVITRRNATRMKPFFWKKRFALPAK